MNRELQRGASGAGVHDLSCFCRLTPRPLDTPHLGRLQAAGALVALRDASASVTLLRLFRRWNHGKRQIHENRSRLKLFEGDQSILILLDEMPPYFHYLDTQKVGNGTVADIAGGDGFDNQERPCQSAGGGIDACSFQTRFHRHRTGWGGYRIFSIIFLPQIFLPVSPRRLGSFHERTPLVRRAASDWIMRS
jgi:hypothetical protein